MSWRCNAAIPPGSGLMTIPIASGGRESAVPGGTCRKRNGRTRKTSSRVARGTDVRPLAGCSYFAASLNRSSMIGVSAGSGMRFRSTMLPSTISSM